MRRSNTASWVLVLNGSGTTGGRTMGGSKERIVLPSGAPAVSNNMVAPWMITTRLVGSGKPYAGPPDFLTYNTNVDAYGTIGFTNAIASYSNVADAVTFQNLPSTAIANVTNTFAMTGPASVYALRVDSTSIGYSGTIGASGTAEVVIHAYAQQRSMGDYAYFIDSEQSANWWVGGLTQFDGPVHSNNDNGSGAPGGTPDNILWFDTSTTEQAFLDTNSDAYTCSDSGPNWADDNITNAGSPSTSTNRPCAR